MLGLTYIPNAINRLGLFFPRKIWNAIEIVSIGLISLLIHMPGVEQVFQLIQGGISRDSEGSWAYRTRAI